MPSRCIYIISLGLGKDRLRSQSLPGRIKSTELYGCVQCNVLGCVRKSCCVAPTAGCRTGSRRMQSASACLGLPRYGCGETKASQDTLAWLQCAQEDLPFRIHLDPTDSASLVKWDRLNGIGTLCLRAAVALTVRATELQGSRNYKKKRHVQGTCACPAADRYRPNWARSEIPHQHFLPAQGTPKNLLHQTLVGLIHFTEETLAFSKRSLNRPTLFKTRGHMRNQSRAGW